ncbi:MAG: hypothetical protein V9E83_09410 [Baekduia sp.]
MSRLASAAVTSALIALAGSAPAATAAAPMQRVAVSDVNRDGRADRVVIVRGTACPGARAQLGGHRLRVRVQDRRRRLSAVLPRLAAASATLELRCRGTRVLRHRVSLRQTRLTSLYAPKPAPKPAATPAAEPAPAASTAATPTSAPATTSEPPTTASWAGWHVLDKPIDPVQQTAIGWCKRSYWLQPWRGYLDTRPASALGQGTGINMNAAIGAGDFARTAAMIGRAGFRTARVEIGWREMSYADPSRLSNPDALSAKLVALRDAGIRPLILLNANHSDPGPVRVDQLRITQPVGLGQTTIQLDADSAAKVVPGLTGFDTGKRPDLLITSVSPSGVATLSRPSPVIVPPGVYAAYTLRYRPFTAPRTLAGAQHPVFEQTLAGWLQYVGAVTELAKSVTGAGGFDVEVWNELSFGSDFLDISKYYYPLPAELQGTGAVTTTILARTTAFLRDPARGLGTIGISDGFASQGPWESAAWEPAGLTTMSKHPYHSFATLSGGRAEAACQPVDATGRPEGTDVGGGRWRDAFTPTTGVLFPENPLSALRTETMIRDLSPITTPIGDVPHGRGVTNPTDGQPLGVRVTETGLIASSLGKSAAAARDLQARWAMRALVAMVAKGATSVELYAARDPEYGLVDEGFFTNSSAADAAAGQSVGAIRRLLAAVGTGSPDRIEPLALESIADDHDHVQFQGDGTAAHPPLYNRDVTAAFPFQRGPRSYAIPAYVMTRDMTRKLPAERYRLTFSGLAAGPVSVSAYDPETDRSVPVSVAARSGSSITVELELTDSPRVISIAP